MSEDQLESGYRNENAPRQELAFETEGAVVVEYVVVLSLLTLGAAFAVLSLGVPLLELYLAEVRWLALPVP